jgi:hypothetical protein
MDEAKKSGPNPWIAIVISTAAFSVSLATLYFTHFYASEDLHAALLTHNQYSWEFPLGSNNYVARGLMTDLVLVNSGNRNVIVSKLEFATYEGLVGGGRSTAFKVGSDEHAAPIVVGPRGVEQVSIRFTFEGIAREGIPKQPPGELVRIPLTLVFTMIGSSAKIQEGSLEAGTVDFKNGELHSYGLIKPMPVRVRQ